jgi:hypothetical protein
MNANTQLCEPKCSRSSGIAAKIAQRARYRLVGLCVDALSAVAAPMDS